jgi:GNAT superfamily N-acetyltransferase
MQHTAPSVEDLYRSMGRMAMRFYGRTPGSHCVVASHALLACSGLGSVFLNVGVVFGAGPGDEDSAAARLREFVARIGSRGVGGYVCLSEGVQAELEPLARELGLEPLPSIPLMSRPYGAAATAGPSAAESGTTAPGGGRARPARVERVTTELGLAEFLAVSEAAFDLPSDLYGRVVTPRLLRDPAVAAYLFRLDGAAVGCVCVVDDEGLVGISGMATLPELQGRGIGGRLLEHVLAEYRDGARAFFLTASEAGQRLYRRHGFSVVDAATAWVVSRPAGT